MTDHGAKYVLNLSHSDVPDIKIIPTRITGPVCSIQRT